MDLRGRRPRRPVRRDPPPPCGDQARSPSSPHRPSDDLVVVNTSATRAAAVDGLRGDGRPVTVHLSHPTPHGDGWIVELPTPGGNARLPDAHVGELVHLPRGVTAVLIAAHPDPFRRSGSRLWLAHIPVEGGVPGWLQQVGRPVTYGHLRSGPPLA